MVHIHGGKMYDTSKEGVSVIHEDDYPVMGDYKLLKLFGENVVRGRVYKTAKNNIFMTAYRSDDPGTEQFVSADMEDVVEFLDMTRASASAYDDAGVIIEEA